MAQSKTEVQTSAPPELPKPNPALKPLDVMVGTWDLRGRETGPEGEITGRATFEWLEGGYFLVQRFDIDYIGDKIKGLEVIGYDPTKGGLASDIFDNMGNHLEYTYEVGDDTITIWAGPKGTETYFRGEFGPGRDSYKGRWVWPGGGYDVTATRVQ